jgi:hypothetical protein
MAMYGTVSGGRRWVNSSPSSEWPEHDMLTKREMDDGSLPDNRESDRVNNFRKALNDCLYDRAPNSLDITNRVLSEVLEWGVRDRREMQSRFSDLKGLKQQVDQMGYQLTSIYEFHRSIKDSLNKLDEEMNENPIIRKVKKDMANFTLQNDKLEVGEPAKAIIELRMLHFRFDKLSKKDGSKLRVLTVSEGKTPEIMKMLESFGRESIAISAIHSKHTLEFIANPVEQNLDYSNTRYKINEGYIEDRQLVLELEIVNTGFSKETPPTKIKLFGCDFGRGELGDVLVCDKDETVLASLEAYGSDAVLVHESSINSYFIVNIEKRKGGKYFSPRYTVYTIGSVESKSDHLRFELKKYRGR